MSGDTDTADILVHMHIAMCFFFFSDLLFDFIKKKKKEQSTSEICLNVS